MKMGAIETAATPASDSRSLTKVWLRALELTAPITDNPRIGNVHEDVVFTPLDEIHSPMRRLTEFMEHLPSERV
jgi:hypothetical protein